MFEISWSELLILAIVLMVFVGPKDLPALLRTLGKHTGIIRGFFGDFKAQFNVMLREFEIEEREKEGGAPRPRARPPPSLPTSSSTSEALPGRPAAPENEIASAAASDDTDASVRGLNPMPPMPMPAYALASPIPDGLPPV
jgi:sec-independent protein translocase protein TatB